MISLKHKSVDIIIPYFKREQKIIKLIKSLNILNYHTNSVKIYLILDGCSLNKKLIKKLSKFRINIISNSKNSGPSYSRNRGIRLSKAEYIWFLDSDARIFNKNILKNFIEFMINFKIDGVTGYREKFLNNYFVQTPRCFDNYITLEIFKSSKFFNYEFNNMVAMTSLFVQKKKFIKKFGKFDSNLRIKEDEELISRVNKKKRNFLIHKNALVEHLPDKKNSQDLFIHLLKVIKVRNYIITKKKKSLSNLFLNDIKFFLEYSFEKFFYNQKFRSRRLEIMKKKMSFVELFVLSINLLKSYMFKLN